MKPTPRLLQFLACSALLASASTGFAQTVYRWNGTTADFTTASNWTVTTGTGSTPLPTGGTIAVRVNVGASGALNPVNALNYGAAQGTTIFNTTDRVLVIGNDATNNASGTVTISGGVFDSRTTGTTSTSDAISNARTGNSGTLNIAGGTYTNVSGVAKRLNVGLNGGTANLNVSAGNLISGFITFGNHAGTVSLATTSNVTLSGTGVIETGGFTRESSVTPSGISNITSNITLNGGTLRARDADNANFLSDESISGNALISAGGARIDSNGFNIGISQTLAENGSSPGGGLIKQGTGTLTLSAANTYTGATSITGGTLALSGSGSIANSSTITINSSTSLSITGLTGNFTVGASQSLGGSGSLTATGKTVFANGTLTPGNSPGTFTQDGGTLQLGANGDLNWQVYDADAAAGTGYDTVNLINGASLDLSALSESNPYNINLWSLSSIGPDANGSAIDFNNTLNYAWTLFSTGTAITGFDLSKFDINVGSFNGTSGFANTLNGSFSLALADSNTDLVLTYTAIPEPGAALLGGLGLLVLLRRRR